VINKLIASSLASLHVPVAYLRYHGKEVPYITYFCYNEQGESWAENEEIATGYYVQIDVWSKTDYSNLVSQVESAMKDAGFTRTTAQDLPEYETELFHKAIRFSIINSK